MGVSERAIELSVVVLNYRTPEQTVRAIRSVAAEVSPSDIETIVVDNASDDASPELILQQSPSTRLICLEKNLGFASGMNAGIRESRGRYVLLLNSDVEAEPDSVGRLMEFARNNPDVGLVAPLLVGEDGSPRRSVLLQPNLSGALIPGLGKLRSKRWRRRIKGAPLDVEATEGAAVLVTRRALDAAGMLDEDFFFYHEIVEWCMRIRDNGFRTVLLPSARMKHLCGGSTDGVWLPSRIELKRSEYQLLEKRLGRVIRGYAIAHDLAIAATRCLAYGCASALGSREARTKLSLHRAVLRWLAMRMPDRNDPRYISRFGRWA